MKNILFILFLLPILCLGQGRIIPIDYSVDYRKNLQVRDTSKLDKVLFEDGTIQNTAYRKDSVARQIHDSIKNISTVESDPIWISDSSHYISKSQAAKQIHDSIAGFSIVETDPVWLSDSSNYISKSQARKDIHDSISTISLIESDPVWISDSSTYLSKTIAGTLYHPRLGLTTLNFSADTAKFRGKVKINDSTVIYLPNQTNFIGSIYFGTGGKYSIHTSSTQSYYNTSLGIGALQSNTTGSGNFALGYLSMFNTTTGFNNVAIGRESFRTNISGTSTIAIGTNSLYYATGSQNIAIGPNAGQYISTGQRNVIIGGSAIGYGNVDSCTIIGFRAGYGTSGKGLNQKGQIKIGPQAGYTDTTNYTLYFDYSSSTNFQTPLIGGRFDLNRVSINKLMPACGDSTLNVGGGIDARGLKLSNNASINKLKTIQISAALTDGAPTNAEINTATGTTPANVGAGWQCTIKDNNGSGLLYKIESDGTNWFYIVMTQAL